MSKKNKQKFQKRTELKKGDIAITTNQRLNDYYKGKDSNSRPVVVTNTGDNPKVNRIIGVSSNNKKKLGKERVELKYTRGLSKKSSVDKKQIGSVFNKKSEIKKNPEITKKKKLDLSDRSVISSKVGKTHWKDKKSINKLINKKGK